MAPPGDATTADREHELQCLRALAEAADAWARWRRRGAVAAASPEEQQLLSALDRLGAAGGHSGRHIVVICSACRRARDASQWVALEAFLTERAGIEFSHGMCPDCMARRYPSHMAEPD
jgi:hypothetical protein